MELIGEALYEPALETFPFIRFTNWKQDALQMTGRANYQALFPFIRFTNWKQGEFEITISLDGSEGFHSYASRIGSKSNL